MSNAFVDRDAVAGRGAGTEFIGVDVPPAEQLEARLRRDAHAVGAAAVGEHDEIGAHVGCGGGDAAVGRGFADRGRRGKRPLARIRPVVAAHDVAVDRAVEQVEGDARLGRGHCQPASTRAPARHSASGRPSSVASRCPSAS